MSLIAVAVICVAGVLLGLRIGLNLGRREIAAKRPAISAPPKALCGCGHHLSTHAPEDNRCHYTSRQATKWDEYEDPTKYELVQCSCRQYVGPRPIDDLFTPGYLPLDGSS